MGRRLTWPTSGDAGCGYSRASTPAEQLTSRRTVMSSRMERGRRAPPAHCSPAIAPRDSFVARFTPPRAGTLIYHPHADEVRQQQAGLSGAIVVLDDPRSFDPARDIVFLISTPRLNAEGGTVFLNGTNKPAAREWRVGERYRLRLVNIHTARPSMITRRIQDSTVLTWRPIAQDGMDLPPERAVARRAH